MCAMQCGWKIVRDALCSQSRAGMMEALEARQMLATYMDTGGDLPDPPNVGPMDLDGDGDLDMALITAGPGNNAGTILLYRNTGNGTMVAGSAQPFSYSGEFRDRVWYNLDADGDGDTDFAYAGRLLINDGTGSFSVLEPATLVPMDPYVVGDVNGDGRSDVVRRDNAGRRFELLLATGTGVFDAPIALDDPTSPLLGQPQLWITRANADAREDFVIAYTFADGAKATLVTLQQADGSFVRPTVQIARPAPQAFLDVSGDGRADLIAADGLSVRLADALGEYREEVLTTLPSFSLWGDIDGDGRADLAGAELQGGTGKFVAYLALPGIGVFAPAMRFGQASQSFTNTTSTTVLPFAVADMNGDGRGDVLERQVSRLAGGGLFIRNNEWWQIRSDVLSVDYPPSTQPLRAEDGVTLRAPVTGRVEAGRAAQTRLQWYVDSNANGVFDWRDTPLGGSQAIDPASPAVYSATMQTTLTSEQPYGALTLFVVVRDDRAYASTRVNVRHWARVSVAEGYKSASVDEHVAMVNHLDQGVAYAIRLRYDDGTTQIVNEGTLDPHRRDGFSISLRDNPGASGARADTPYAIEIVSERPIGAQLTRYDSRGNGGFRAGASEAFVSGGKTVFFEGGLSGAADRADYLLIYNLSDTQARLRFAFHADGVNLVTFDTVVAGFARSGVYLRDVPALAGRNEVSVEVTSVLAVPVQMMVTSYDFTRGSATLRHAGDGIQTGPILLAAPLWAAGGETDAANSAIVITNHSGGAREFVIMPRDSAGSALPATRVVVPARGSARVTPLAGRPGAAAFTAAVSAIDDALLPFSVRVEQVGPSGEGGATGPGTMGTDLIFADGFVRQNDATTAQELVLAHPSEVGVPISVTIQYILLNGAMQTINLLLDAGSVKRVSAAQPLAGLGTRWYSTRVITSAPVLASVRHVDMRAGGAWISGATVLRA